MLLESPGRGLIHQNAPPVIDRPWPRSARTLVSNSKEGGHGAPAPSPRPVNNCRRWRGRWVRSPRRHPRGHLTGGGCRQLGVERGPQRGRRVLELANGRASRVSEDRNIWTSRSFRQPPAFRSVLQCPKASLWSLTPEGRRRAIPVSLPRTSPAPESITVASRMPHAVLRRAEDRAERLKVEQARPATPAYAVTPPDRHPTRSV